MPAMTQASLEQKSREELDSIARAMGGKPSSKARKSEIAELIMKLVGPEQEQASEMGQESDTYADGVAADSSDLMDEDSTDNGQTQTSARSDQVRSFSYDSDDAGHPVETLDEDSEANTTATAGRSRYDSRSNSNTNSNYDSDSDYGNRRNRNRDRSRNRRPDDAHQRGNSHNHSTETVEVEGYLDLREEGYGFLRVSGHLPTKSDVYVSVKQIKQFGLRKGDRVVGQSRPSGRGEKNPALTFVTSVNEREPHYANQRPKFEDLTPLFPDVRLRMERTGDPKNMTTRIIDLLSPIGKGQRGMIVSPPKAGKTTIMKEIARSIEVNNPEVALLVLLVDERPEEVTDMRRWLKSRSSEVIASTFDRPATEHTYIAEMALDRAKRMVEYGKDVVIILDGITRLARGYNQALPGSGRLMSGGMDAGSLYPPKKFFGAARNVEEGGSLTILGTALVETGSKMDEVIFEEFKGTGNMELRLDRRSAERRVYPAIDVDASSTRHEELLFEREQLQQVWTLRRVLSGLVSENDGNSAAGLELLIDRLRQFPSNEAFLSEVSQGQIRT